MNAAVFVDFENLFSSLQNRSELSGHRTRDLALTLLESLKARLRDDGLQLVLGRSYAAFDTYPGMEVAHDLALMGFDPHYVLVAPSGRNSADVQLTVDVCRVLYRRADIETFVIVAGDRDFIPIARQVLEEGRGLLVVAITDSTSGDLRMRVGPERFLNALDLLPKEPAPRVEPAAPPPAGVPVAALDEAGGAPVFADDPEDAAAVAEIGVAAGGDRGSRAAIVGHIPVTWRTGVADGSAMARYAACLDLIVKAQVRHGSREIWLSPFLKGPMSQHFSHLVHPERRALVNELRARGAIRVEERENQFADHPYSVIVLVDDHPWVQEAMERHQRG
ncbi:MAG: NYN domain-containing protein [Planctomycetota bacterium]